MIGSRLHRRYAAQTITVKSKTLVSNQYTEASALTGLRARRVPMDADEQISEAGAVVIATDVFWFEPASVGAALPAITENHVLVDAGGVRYEVVMRPTNQAGGDKRLKVVTRRVS
jgi:hypothetical protein